MAEESFQLDNANAPKFKLVATSRGCADLAEQSRNLADSFQPINHLKSAQWSADGTCVLTNSADNRIRTFIIPPDLLEERTEPLQLESYAEIVSHEPTDAVTGYPGFDLQDASTTLVLSAVNEHPIQLHSALTSELVASYPLINSTTETYIKPQCLTFTSDGSRFVAGSESLVSTFDLSRPGQDPILVLPTGPKKNKSTWSNPATSMRGIVSALTFDPQHNILAAGTLTRYVGLYDSGGSGECLGVFSLQDTEADHAIGGRGITQLLWSPCAKYLYLAERKSLGIMMYDIRNTGQLLGWLEERQADTNQRMYVDLACTGMGGGEHEIWAGGADGCVRMWKNPHNHEGAISCDEKHLAHSDVVNSSAIHPAADVLVTASGQRHVSDSNKTHCDKLATKKESCLKIWSLNHQKGHDEALL